MSEGSGRLSSQADGKLSDFHRKKLFFQLSGKCVFAFWCILCSCICFPQTCGCLGADWWGASNEQAMSFCKSALSAYRIRNDPMGDRENELVLMFSDDSASDYHFSMKCVFKFCMHSFCLSSFGIWACASWSRAVSRNLANSLTPKKVWCLQIIQ